ncbi:outer membrane protein [Wohlfahrtiimonas larvae]|uniref:Outer membrane protein beta-barrel domain-containing protein n=1 Tax=Wohlfahrtiimonas larvae TaxID=1157986 RepID=A0ABP9MTC1_9GAMM|nr:outer membrane protein [Wohlfahrtiimonas larvae]
MKKILFISVALVCSTAAAEDIRQYVSAKGTVIRMENKLSSTYGNYGFGRSKDKTLGGFRAAYGLDFPIAVTNGHLRGEIEYGYNSKSKINGRFLNNAPVSNQVKTQFIMLNAYYDFTNSTDFTPYVGAGIGYARLKANSQVDYQSFSKKKNNFIWNLGVGVAYEVTPNISLDVGYRYVNYGKVSSATNIYSRPVNARSKLKAHEFNFGIRYTF